MMRDALMVYWIMGMLVLLVALTDPACRREFQKNSGVIVVITVVAFVLTWLPIAVWKLAKRFTS